MGSAILFDAARSQEIEDNSIISGLVDASGNLILSKHNGDQVNAGNVRGATGPSSRYMLPNNTSGTESWIRIATMDAIDDTTGFAFNLLIGGLGDRAGVERGTILLEGAQRSTSFNMKAWGWNLGVMSTTVRPVLYYKKLAPYFYEIWIRVPRRQYNVFVTELSMYNGLITADELSATIPEDLVAIDIQDSDYTPRTLFADSLSTNSVVTGLLEATYRGGPAKVKVNNVLSTEAYGWLAPYNPSGSRQVRMIKTENSWLISGQVEDNEIPLTLNYSKWGTYGEQGSGSWADIPRSTRLPSGLVVLKGMLNPVVSVADGDVIAVLPVGHRPDNNILTTIEVSDVSRCVYISASTGEIRVSGGGWGQPPWLSLSGISFWAAGVAQWTNIGNGGSSWGSNFARDPGWAAEYGEPGFWKDPYGFVWFRGLARISVATSVDNTVIINLPSTHQASVQEHHRTASGGQYGGVGAQPANGLVWKPNTPGTVGTWVSLNGIVVKTAEAEANNPWFRKKKNPKLLNSWVIHNPTNTQPDYLLREDGLRMAYGMFSSGTLNVPVMLLETVEMLPARSRITIATISNNARARFSIYPGYTDADATRGGLAFDQGSNVWYSLDGSVWVP